MKHPVKNLRTDLEGFTAFLRQGVLFSISEEERDALEERAAALLDRLEHIDRQELTVGLIGGTGVGKSTLMNALAGSDIASTSHRRPHTDKIVIYRHVEAAPIPAESLSEVPWQEVTHQGGGVKGLLLCDLPDFDSLVEEHRLHVLRFMEHLDVLLWITSPEKYADGRFYEFLEEVPKAKENFFFILNKVDVLFADGKSDRGYDQMARMVETFRGHLRRHGIPHPLLYVLSSLDARRGEDPAPWNQFWAFRQHLFQERNRKHVQSIKAANLAVERDALLAAARRELAFLRRLEAGMDEAERDLAARRDDWAREGARCIDQWLDRHVGPESLFHLHDPSCLVGPAHGMALLLQALPKRARAGSESPWNPVPPDALQEMVPHFRRQLEWIENRLLHRALLEDLPRSFREELGRLVDVPGSLQTLQEGFSAALAGFLSASTRPVFRVFRLRQRMVYALVFALLLLALGGPSSWKTLFESPGFGSVIPLFLAALDRLFSMKGLAALGAYALMNLFLGFRFLGQYRKRLTSASHRLKRAMKESLTAVWEERLQRLREDLVRFRLELRSRRASLASLHPDGGRRPPGASRERTKDA